MNQILSCESNIKSIKLSVSVVHHSGRNRFMDETDHTLWQKSDLYSKVRLNVTQNKEAAHKVLKKNVKIDHKFLRVLKRLSWEMIKSIKVKEKLLTLFERSNQARGMVKNFELCI